MMDLSVLPLWMVLSWVIRQIENGTEDTGTEGLPTEAEPFEPVEQAIKLAIVAFSLLLLGLSISAYKKTALRRILYAAVAFGLFAVQMFFDYLSDAVAAFDAPINDVVFSGITLAILALFFMAIVKKK